MSIRQQILYAFTFVIFLTVVLVQSIAFVVTKNRFSLYTQEETQIQADYLANFMAVEYADAGSWEALNIQSSESIRWILNAPYVDEPHGQFQTGEDTNEGIDVVLTDEQSAFARENEDWLPPMERIVVVDTSNTVLFDNHDILSTGSKVEGIEGVQSAIKLPKSVSPVGFIYFNLDSPLLDDEANYFLLTTFTITAVGGVLTLGFAFLIAFRLSKRISNPLVSLTHDTERMAADHDAIADRLNTSNEVQTLQHSFDQMKDAIQTQKNLRQRLLNDLSHEINTPLSVIQLEAKGMTDGLQTAEQAAKNITAEINMLKHLVQDLNWIAETDSGKLPLVLTEFDLIQAIQQEIIRWTSVTPQRRILLITDVSENKSLGIRADQARLMRAVSNVISNAIHYSQSGSDIRIEVTSNEQLIIKIIDNGIGISPRDLPHVMDRFYRVDESRNRHTGGRGIGLSIVRSVMEAHRGQVEIYSEGLSKGSEVSLIFPLTILTH